MNTPVATVKAAKKAEPKVAQRVAIYCRKSTEEGLDQEFNSLDAQRQSCELFAASQKNEGWEVIPEHFDDGGWSGSNTERPALKRLLAEVQAGRVQVIMVYKLDRMSRSLTDFVTLLQMLEKHQVAFVSVTQHFNTATPMGRLTLNILICFAQFERENMIERVRDKVAATKRQGRWCGGVPVLGYDVAPGGRKLVVNEAEAERVRAIFALYLELGSLGTVAQELARRGWTNKAWTSGTGVARGGKPFSKSTLSRLLTSILYTGQVLYRGEIFPGDHPAIIDREIYGRVQNRLAAQRVSGCQEARTKHFALLRGLLRCGPCGCGMAYTYAKRAAKLYGYYTCQRSREHGASTCPLPSLPAAEIERLVVDELATIAKTPHLVKRVAAEAMSRQQTALVEARERLAEAERMVASAKAAAARAPEDANQAGLLRQAQGQVTALAGSVAELEAHAPNARVVGRVMSAFDGPWAELSPRDQSRLLHSLVERISLNGHTGKIVFSFRSDLGSKTLAGEAES
jgi:site-specific DNA recombinase